jgi:hypothetical protein
MEVSEKMTSKRHVSRHLFEGFRKIYDIHGVPIMPFDWQVDENGMPKTLKLNALQIRLSLSDGYKKLLINY